MDRHRTVEIRSVADGFTRVIAHPAVDGGEWIILDEPSPRGFVPTGGGVCQPGLDVLAGGASGIARRHQVDVDGAAFAHRPGPRVPVAQVRKRRDVLEASHQPGNRTVVPGISSTTRPWHSAQAVAP